MTPSLSLAQSGSGQGGNGSVPKKEREIHGVDFRVVNSLFRRVKGLRRDDWLGRRRERDN